MGQRQSARQVEARRLARERAVGFLVREEKLQELAADFFVAEGEVEEVLAAAQVRAARVMEQAHAQAAAARARAASAVTQMLDAGQDWASVAERLGTTVRALRRLRGGSVEGSLDDLADQVGESASADGGRAVLGADGPDVLAEVGGGAEGEAVDGPGVEDDDGGDSREASVPAVREDAVESVGTGVRRRRSGAGSP